MSTMNPWRHSSLRYQIPCYTNSENELVLCFGEAVNFNSGDKEEKSKLDHSYKEEKLKPDLIQNSASKKQIFYVIGD